MFLLYIVAFFAYMYIRITKTLSGLGSYLVYGIFVLAVEVLGATTTLIYGAPHLVPASSHLGNPLCRGNLPAC